MGCNSKAVPAAGCLQVCGVDLSSLKQVKAYCLKKKVCSLHLQVSQQPHWAPHQPASVRPSVADSLCRLLVLLPAGRRGAPAWQG